MNTKLLSAVITLAAACSVICVTAISAKHKRSKDADVHGLKVGEP